ncbi:MAG: hypothetical protein U0694_22945 [Anaerolineae bacterium]
MTAAFALRFHVGGWVTTRIFRYLRDLRRYRRLKQNGIVLPGDLIEITGVFSAKIDKYHVTVHYRFQTSNGRTLTRKEQHARNDLRNARPAPARHARFRPLRRR